MILKKFLLVLFIIILVAVGGVYYLTSTSKPLGVSWSEKDYQSYLVKVGVADGTVQSSDRSSGSGNGQQASGGNSESGDGQQASGSNSGSGDGQQASGSNSGSGDGQQAAASSGSNGSSKPYFIDASFTDEEISAMLSKECEKTNAPVKDVRVRFLPGNQMEATFVTTEKMKEYIPRDQLEKFKIAENLIANRPVYIKMKVEKSSSKTISLDIEDAKVGRIGIPQSALATAQDALESSVNSQLSSLNNFSIDQFSFDSDSASFKGNLQSAPRKLD